jgi:hypothetical protein
MDESAANASVPVGRGGQGRIDATSERRPTGITRCTTFGVWNRYSVRSIISMACHIQLSFQHKVWCSANRTMARLLALMAQRLALA